MNKPRHGYSSLLIQYDHVHTFRKETDDSFVINGYNGCDVCGDYDKMYCLLDCEGRNLTKLEELSRSDVSNFIENTYVLCGQCAGRFDLFAIKRGYWRYNISDSYSPTKLSDSTEN